MVTVKKKLADISDKRPRPKTVEVEPEMPSVVSIPVHGFDPDDPCGDKGKGESSKRDW